MDIKQLKGFFWVINTLKHSKGLTLREINELWLDDDELSYGLELRSQTFYRWRNQMRHLWGVSICCDNHHRYHIENMNVIKWQQVNDCCKIIKQSDIKPETIEIEVYGHAVSRVRERPFNYNQIEIYQDKHCSRFRFTLRPNNTFCGTIMAAGNVLKVITPQWLALKTKEIHEKAAYLYKEC